MELGRGYATFPAQDMLTDLQAFPTLSLRILTEASLYSYG